MVLWRPTRPSKTNTQKDVLFIIGDWNAKVGSQEIPGERKWKVKSLSCVQFFVTPWTVAHQAPPSMEFSRQEYWHGLPFPSLGDIPDLGIESGSPALEAAKTRLGADCGSDHELFIAKFRLKLKKVGKTTRPFRYDVNQIPYNYTVKVGNRFKGLYLIECQKNYGWRFITLYRRQGSRPSPRKRNAKKAKWLSEEALQIAVKRREVKGKGEKERYTHLNAEFQRIARRDRKAFFSDQCKEIEENNRMGKTRDLFKKIRISREHFM